MGRVRILPGMTESQAVFLDSELISVEWSVREITLQDIYEINLNATYEVNVPTAVVVTEPMSVNLPLMGAGEIFYGEIKISNHGLVKAQNLKFKLPTDDEYLKYELLTDNIPTELAARGYITVSYRVIQLKSFQSDGSDETGGSTCTRRQQVMECTYDVECANGVILHRKSGTWVSHNSGDCEVSGSGGGGGGASSGGSSWIGGFGGYGGGSAVVQPSSDSISGLPICREVPNSRQCRVLDGNQDGI